MKNISIMQWEKYKTNKFISNILCNFSFLNEDEMVYEKTLRFVK